MELRETLDRLLEIKQQLNNLPEKELNGTKVDGLLSELRGYLASLAENPAVDKTRLTNLVTFVGMRTALDPMVRKVLLGLITKLSANPAPLEKPGPNFNDLMTRIPGLKNALEEKPLGESSPPKHAKPRIEPDIPSLFSKIPGLEQALKDTYKGDARTAALEVASEADIIKGGEPIESNPDQSGLQGSLGEIGAGARESVASSAENTVFDTRELLGFFLQEASEQVEKLSSGLLELEKGGARLDLVNELFRIAHTLKGSSGTMGFHAIVQITHLAEDVLDNLRQSRCTVSSELVDLLLGVADRVKGILAEIQDGGEGNCPVDDLVHRLSEFLGKPESTEQKTQSVSDKTGGENEFSLDEKEAILVRQMHQTGKKVWDITVKFDPAVLMPAVRAVMAVRRAESVGQVIKSVPANEVLRKENRKEFHILLGTECKIGGIEKAILEVSEIEELAFKEFADLEIPVQVIDVAEVVRNREIEQNNPISTQAGDKAGTVSPPINNQTVRVPAEKLDFLLNLVGEMVIARTRLVAVGEELKLFQAQNQSVYDLNETTVYLGRLMNELQERVMDMRMLPIGYVFSRFPRMVRDLARRTGKQVELAWFGEETELDKTIVQEISDPLMHIIRNCVDHGIESCDVRVAAGKDPVGKVIVEAFHEGSHIIVTVSDDGRGIDIGRVKEKAIACGIISPAEELSQKEIVNLIFLPGLSTAEVVTDLSGRGVGMDAVKKSLINLGGMIDVETVTGKGTTFTIRLPLTLAIIQALMVSVGSETYAIPLSSVLETLRIFRTELKSVGGHPVITLRGNTLPLISLEKHLGLEPSVVNEQILYVVVVGFGEKRLGLLVDDLQGQHEIVIKSLGDILADVPVFSGATIRGDGRVTLILDISSLIHETLVINRA